MKIEPTDTPERATGKLLIEIASSSPPAIACSTSSARYTVLTWDAAAEQYTEQEGMVNPTIDVDIHGLRRALKELRSLGYPADRWRDKDGDYHSDWAVLVERTDDPLIDSMDFPAST